ncbi:MAG: CvpA family protein [Bdellovibrionales bacterium]|nr:CvpA family protein [Bdellovibrionales bacterium]
MFDVVIIGVFLYFAISGFIKGVVSQFAAVLGIVLAFVLANPLAPFVTNISSFVLGTSPDASRMIAPMVAGITVYFLIILIGQLIEHKFVNKVAALKGINRVGGALVSIAKGMIIVMVLLFFLHFIPASLLDAWAPKLYQSKTYQFSLKHNPLGTEDIVQRFKNYRDQKKKAKAQEKQSDKKQVEDVIGDYLLEQAIENPKELMNQITK